VVNFFPPTPKYPKNYDNDSTLFKVYNTSETITTENNQPWAEEIAIKPVDDNRPEVWADNGFATIDGELFYYDSVEKNAPVGSGLTHGKIVVNEYGGIVSIPVIQGGSGYFYPVVKIVESGAGAKGNDAKIEVIVSNIDPDTGGSITEFKIIQPGKGYKASNLSIVFEGKVTKFKRCSRNLGGSHTKFNKAGTDVRGFVIAEHHNQISDAIIKTETFIGQNFDEDKKTLDWRIRNLQGLSIIFDDYSCPDVGFSFYIVSEDPLSGTVIQYDVIIEGNYNSYILDFGDGQSTNTSTSGTHKYAVSATIDPIVTVNNNNCTIVQTAVARTTDTEPVAPTVAPAFSINIPAIPTIPPIVFPSIPTPSTPQIPPIVFPCLDIGPIGPINVPSIIEIVPPVPSIIAFDPLPDIPSLITFDPLPDIPSLIAFDPLPEIPSLIAFDPLPEIPSLISITAIDFPTLISITPVDFPTLISITPVYIPTLISITPLDITALISFTTISIPTLINVIDDIPSVISVIPFNVNFNISFTAPNNLWISWTNPPLQNFWVSWVNPISYEWWTKAWYVSWVDPSSTNPNHWWNKNWWVSWTSPNINNFWVSWAAPTPNVWVSWSTPPPISCVVTVNCPTSTPMVSNRSNLEDINPDFFELSVGDIGIPSEIKVVFPEEIPDIKIIHDVPAIIKVMNLDLPSIINVHMEQTIPSEIRVFSENIPSIIELKGTDIPSVIEIDATNIPKSIPIEVPNDFPSIIKLDASSLPDKIQVVGIPSTIELVGAPSEIKLVLPEKPEVELVYKGAPIDVKINLDVGRLTGENDKAQCVAIVPCGN
jgi:hypothetical protein